MTPACAIVLAGLCLRSPYDKAADLIAMYHLSDGAGVAQPAVVRRLGVLIEAAVSDVVDRSQDPTGLPRACVSEICVTYLKTCSVDGLQCEWDWDRAPNAGGRRYISTRTVWIKAESRTAMAAAVQALAVQAGEGELRPSVALATMDQLSPLGYLPPCDAAFQKDCVNLFYGRVPEVPLTREQRMRTGD